MGSPTRCRILRTAVMLLLFSLAGTEAARAEAPLQILLINSYHQGFTGSDDIVRGFRDELNRSMPGVYIKTEYLDSKNYSGAGYDRKLIDMLQYKYKGRHFELVVTADDYAFNIVEKSYADIFAPAPVVFCGTNGFDVRRVEAKSFMVGIDEDPSFRETIEFVLKSLPGVKRVIVIHDDSLTGRINSEIFRREAAQFDGRLQFEYLSGLRLESLAERLAALTPDAVAFYFASFVKDRRDESYASNDALRILSKGSPVPIFGGWEFNLGHGIIGGKLVNLHEHGTAAARFAARILQGANPAALPRLSPSPNVFMFDDNELKRFLMGYEQLPPGSIVVNQRPSFYQRNRAEIFISLSLVLSVIVAGSFVFLYRSKQNLQHALHEIKTLQGILPICSSCKKIRDDRGSWMQIEQYIGEHSEAQFSHGMCPECANKLYPQYMKRISKDLHRGT